MNSAVDTICARATAVGIGAIAVVRISVQKAISIVSKCFSKPLAKVDSHTVHFGVFKNSNGVALDEVLVTVFHHGKSFTGRKVLRFHAMGHHMFSSKYWMLWLHQDVEWLILGSLHSGHF